MEDATKDAICRPGCRKEQSRRLHSFGGTAPVGAEHAGRPGRAGRVGAREPGRPGGDGGERRLRARLGGSVARGRCRSPDRGPETGSPLRQSGRTAGQERSDRRRHDRLVRRGVSRPRGPTTRSRTRRDRPAGCGSDGPERRGRSDQATGRASPAGRRRQGAGRDRQDDPGRAAQGRRRDRRQNQSQSGIARRAEIIARCRAW